MLILGHRGTGVTMHNSKPQEQARKRAARRGPENTLKAFDLALRHGADGIEFDVYRTADNDLAVIHDDDLSLHVKNESGTVSGSPMTRLRRLDAGDGEAIPALRDVFSLAASHGTPLLNIELAGKNTALLAWQQAVSSSYPLERLLFSSFDHTQLAEFKKHAPAAKTGLLFRPRIPPRFGLPLRRPAFSEKYMQGALQTIAPFSIHLLVPEATPRLIAFALARNLEVFAWTRNETRPSEGSQALDFARKYRENPHIHLITDFPATIKAAL